MLFPPVHNCDSVEKRRDVNVKDDGELARDGRRCSADAYEPPTTSAEKRAAAEQRVPPYRRRAGMGTGIGLQKKGVEVG